MRVQRTSNCAASSVAGAWVAKRSVVGASAGLRINRLLGSRQLLRKRRALEIETAPEHEHGVQHLVRRSDETFLVDMTVGEQPCELVRRVLRVVRFDARVPREEADVEGFQPRALAVASPALDELVPETGGRPVLDCPRGGRCYLVILVRVEPLQLVAKVQGGAGAEAPLAEIRKIEPELARHARKQLEVRG